MRHHEGTIAPADATRLTAAAQDAGMPPYAQLVYAVLLRFSSSKWTCRVSMRTIARLAQVNKDTATRYCAWLCERGVCTPSKSDRATTSYHITVKAKWKSLTVRPDRTEKAVFNLTKLSGSAAQFAVRPDRTDEKPKIKGNCPTRPDVVYIKPIQHEGVPTSGTESLEETLSRYSFMPIKNPVEAKPKPPNGHHL